MQRKLTEKDFDIIRDRVIPPNRINNKGKVNLESIHTILEFAIWLDLDISSQLSDFNDSLRSSGIKEFEPDSLSDKKAVYTLLESIVPTGFSLLDRLEQDLLFLKKTIHNSKTSI